MSGNYDDGPFRLNLRYQKATATRGSQFNRLGFDVLRQMGHNVYAIEARSLPPQTKVVFNSMDGGVVVAVIPYCQGFPSQYDNSQSPVAISVNRYPSPLPTTSPPSVARHILLAGATTSKPSRVGWAALGRIRRPAAAAAWSTWGSTIATSLTCRLTCGGGCEC